VTSTTAGVRALVLEDGEGIIDTQTAEIAEIAELLAA